ncbi:MAG: hypothetical protein ACYTF6_05880, partial [Planctomycetota bacterium]
ASQQGRAATGGEDKEGDKGVRNLFLYSRWDGLSRTEPGQRRDADIRQSRTFWMKKVPDPFIPWVVFPASPFGQMEAT